MLTMPDIIETVGRNKKVFSIPTKLFSNNIITLFDEINDDSAYVIITQLIYLDTLDDTDDIKLYINSPGGSVTAGMAIIDTMEAMKRKVQTVGIGSCSSMGAMILLCGTGERKSLKSNRIMLHSISSGTQGTYHDQKIDFRETEFLQNKMMELIAERSNSTLDNIKKITERDYYMSAEQAKELGLIDSIVN